MKKISKIFVATELERQKMLLVGTEGYGYSPDTNLVVSTDNKNAILGRPNDSNSIHISLIASGTTYPLQPEVGQMFFDSAQNIPVFCKSAERKSVLFTITSSSIITAGSIVFQSGNESITVSVAITDSISNILDNIRTKTFADFFIYKKNDTSIYFVSKKLENPTLTATIPSGIVTTLVNQTVGVAANWVKADGSSALVSTSTTTVSSSFNDDINMNIIYGQSLATGGTTISAENFYTAKQFNGGVLLAVPLDDNINSLSYNQSYFGNIINMTSTGNGLNARMVTKKWNELITAEDGINLNTFNFSLMGFNAGVSEYAWYQLNKQNISIDSTGWATLTSFEQYSIGKAYCHLLHGVYFGRERAHAQGKSFNVNTLSWVQGEHSSDKFKTIDQYYANLVTIFTDLNNDIKQITGQKNDVQFIIYQNASFAIYQVPTSPDYEAEKYSEGVPLACLKAARELPNVSFGTPLYPFSVSQATADKTNLSNTGYAMMSSMFGIVAKRVIKDKKTIKPMYPNAISTFSDGTNYFIRVQFYVTVKPLVFDTSGDDGTNMRGHGGQPNYGFSILTLAGQEIITNVRLSTDDSVVIQTSENPVGLSMTYAWTGVFGGGNLRDSQGDTITTTFNNITYRCDNWCPFFRITI